jgi:predicted permease
LFRIALLLFPDWFRRAYGPEMVRDFEAHHARIRAEAGGLAALGFTARAIAEVPLSAYRVRRDPAIAARGPIERGGFGDDLRAAARSLVRAPLWTGAALFIPTLGIGGTVAVFSVLHAVLLRPLPYESPESLVSIWTVNRVQDLRDGSSYENGRDWLERSRSLRDVAFVLRPEFTTATVTSFGEPERIHVGLVSESFFELLGVDPVIGRVFSARDLAQDARVAVIDEGLWAARYASAPDVIGRSVTINGEEVTIVGVAPRSVSLPLRETRIWRLLDVRPPEGRSTRAGDAYWVLGRVAEGATPESAQRELDAIAAGLEEIYPEANRDRGVRVRPLQAEIVGERATLLLWTLFGSMILVLAVGGANVAQLMLTRGVERRRELAIRVSLGASRARVNRQLLLESVLLSGAAGVGGALVAALALEGLVGIIPPDIPLVERVRIDAAVLLVCFGAAGIVAPLVGLLPALAASRTDAATLLRAGGRGTTGRDQRVRSLLVVGEVAMAVVLLASAGLLVRSAIELQAVDPGFDARSTLIARVNLARAGDDPLVLPQAILDEARSMPGVRDASIIGQFFVERIPDQTITVVGSTPRPEGAPTPQLTTDLIVPGFFEAMGVPLLRGRSLRVADVTLGIGSPSMVLVNRSWVDMFAEGRDPVGLQFRWGDAVEGYTHTVVGVVGDLRRTTLEDVSYPQMFFAGGTAGFDMLVRAESDPLALAPAVREIVRRHDPLAAVSGVGTAWERYGSGLAARRFQTLLFGLFAALATVLAAVGLFAVLHQAVAARRREIGIRLALGAAPAGLRRTVLGRGVALTLAGLGIGLGATVLLSGVTARLVYGVTSTDPLTLALVSVSLLAVATLASFVPAMQATRVSPSETLASE